MRLPIYLPTYLPTYLLRHLSRDIYKYLFLAGATKDTTDDGNGDADGAFSSEALLLLRSHSHNGIPPHTVCAATRGTCQSPPPGPHFVPLTAANDSPQTFIKSSLRCSPPRELLSSETVMEDHRAQGQKKGQWAKSPTGRLSLTGRTSYSKNSGRGCLGRWVCSCRS